MRKACVIGWPIAHSRSPLIHRHWLMRYGLEGEYDARAVQPEHVGQFLRSLAALGYAGGNVTLPHKEAAFAMADRRDNAAESVGAANTLWLENGALCASNTDIHGFLANLDEAVPAWRDRGGTAAVLGAGGSSRAVMKGLIDRGFDEIRLVNRTRERAEELAQRFGPAIRLVSWDDRSRALEGCALLVNTTSLGMAGQPTLDISLDRLTEDATVCDLVYSPLETALLAAARRRGLRMAGGLGMLLHQAAPGFERWFGVRPEVTAELRVLVEADVRAAA